MDSDKQALREKIAKILAPTPPIYIFSPDVFYVVDGDSGEVILSHPPEEEPLHG